MFSVNQAHRLALRVCGSLAVAMMLGACQPTFNWRQVRPEGGGVQTLMPCKPDTGERSVPLADQPVVLHMSSCEAGGITYALAWATLPSPAEAPAALRRWAEGARRALHATEERAWAAPKAATVPWQASALQGQDPRGEAVQARIVYLVRGARIVQAAAYGRALPEEHLEPFFAGLELDP